MVALACSAKEGHDSLLLCSSVVLQVDSGPAAHASTEGTLIAVFDPAPAESLCTIFPTLLMEDQRTTALWSESIEDRLLAPGAPLSIINYDCCRGLSWHQVRTYLAADDLGPQKLVGPPDALVLRLERIQPLLALEVVLSVPDRTLLLGLCGPCTDVGGDSAGPGHDGGEIHP